jgi:PII-like signaling protein
VSGNDRLKLTVYHGERDRVGAAFLSDALAAIFARHALETSVVLRGATGFGPRQHVRTDRLLTLSEDLPLVSVAVDEPGRIEAARREIEALSFDGLVTVERARSTPGAALPDVHEETKLTVYAGRGERPDAIVEVLHAHGVAGATVLLGVDGTVRGERRRASFFGRNGEVPLMVIAVGDGERIAAAIAELRGGLHRPTATIERVRVCKRDGAVLGAPHAPGPGALPWQKLTVFSSERTMVAGRPLYDALTWRLREAGCAGATSLRGVWGYHGDHAPHGDVLWQLRRRVPVVSVLVDTPERVARWYPIVDELTAAAGLVTSEAVPHADVRLRATPAS